MGSLFILLLMKQNQRIKDTIVLTSTKHVQDNKNNKPIFLLTNMLVSQLHSWPRNLSYKTGINNINSRVLKHKYINFS